MQITNKVANGCIALVPAPHRAWEVTKAAPCRMARDSCNNNASMKVHARPNTTAVARGLRALSKAHVFSCTAQSLLVLHLSQHFRGASSICCLLQDLHTGQRNQWPADVLYSHCWRTAFSSRSTASANVVDAPRGTCAQSTSGTAFFLAVALHLTTQASPSLGADSPIKCF